MKQAQSKKVSGTHRNFKPESLKDPNRKGELQKDIGYEDLITINSTRPPSDMQASRYCCISNSSDRHKR